MNQPQIEFPSESPINTLKLGGQNKKLFDHLSSGQTIHCMHEAMNRLGIKYLNSRISDLVKNKVSIYRQWITVNEITVREYSLNKF